MGAEIDGILEKKPVSLDELGGTIAVDAYNVLYQFLSIIRQKDGTPLLNSRGEVTSHLSGLFYRTCNLLEKGILPVYVFDGKPSLLKAETIEERSARKQSALEKFKAARAAGDEEEMKIYASQTTHLTGQMVEQSKQLLSLFGIPVIQAKSEGEAQCAHMTKQGIVFATASQDFDSLLFGSPVFIRNLTLAGRRKLPRRNAYVDVVPERFILSENLSRLGLSQQQLVWIGILAGTDFDKGVYGFGAKKALKIVKENPASFETILSAIREKAGEDAVAAVSDWREIEQIFLQPNVFDVGKEDVRLKPLQRDKLVSFMVEQHDFSAERVEASLNRAFAEPADSKQQGLDKWL